MSEQDIVQRLRHEAYCWSNLITKKAPGILLDAADEIERLQRENDDMRQSIEFCSGSCRAPVRGTPRRSQPPNEKGK